MKALDRYLLRELLAPVVSFSLALIFLLLITDIFDNIDDFLRNQTPALVVIQYYGSLVPHFFTQTIAWATWLGAMFLLVNLGFHNELTAMKAVGIKITTIVTPMLFLGFLIGIITFLVSDRMVPKTFRAANDFHDTYIEKKKEKNQERVARNVTYFAGKERLYYFRSFSKAKQKVEGVIVLWLNSASEHNRRQKMVAKSGIWKEAESVWEFENVTEHKMDSRGRILGEPKTFPRKIYPDIRFTPKELEQASSDSEYLSYRELKESIAKLKENGVRVESEAVELQSRLASPWQALVMMLITIPLLARTAQRKLIAVNILICVIFIFAYHVTGAVGIALGRAGKLPPFFSAWAGNILFAIGGLFHMEKGNY